MIQIKLNKNEFDFLREGSFIPNTLSALFHTAKHQEGMYLIEITKRQADEIRDLCGHQLQYIGFDKEYELTPEGEILESLIDKFFF